MEKHRSIDDEVEQLRIATSEMDKLREQNEDPNQSEEVSRKDFTVPIPVAFGEMWFGF
jgi:hypothetical protein